jgi:tRNA dimethylallyltransferase
MMESKPQTASKKLIVIGGPTASGKTEVAIEIAKAFQTEIISADSRQFYKEMKIGTAVPSPEELRLVKHHFIQHISILDVYDVATYEQHVLKKLHQMFQNADQVVLTGGSGLFIDAVCYGLDNIPEVLPAVREKLGAIYEREGLAGLQAMLQQLDPEYFKIVDQKNPRRLQRALEVCLQTGKPYSFYRKRIPEARPFDVIWIALERDRMELINRINARVEKMMAQGLLQEARKLIPYKHLNAMNTVGYKELFAYFEGLVSIEQAVEQIKTNTRQYAKRQMTWLRKNKQYHWFHPESKGEILQYIKANL